VEVEVFVLCQTEAMDLTDMAPRHLIIHPLIIRLPVCTHPMVSHFMALFLAQAEVVSHGVEVVVEFLVAGEGSVVGGGNAWGPRWNQWGLDIQSP